MAQNSLITKALLFSSERLASPEAILYSIAKLALANSTTQHALLTDAETAELIIVTTYLVGKNYDLSLIKSGVPCIRDSVLSHLSADDAKNYTAFMQSILQEKDALTLVQQALEVSTVNLEKAFVKGKSMEDVFALLDEIGNKPATQGEYDFTLRNLEHPEGKNKAAEAPKAKGNPTPAEAPTPEKPTTKETPKDGDIAKLIASDNIATVESGFLLLQAKLMEEIKGQDKAIMKFCRGFFEGEILYRQRTKQPRPKNFFFMFGPPGVGKTMLSNRVADYMNIPAHVFNMSEITPDNFGNIPSFVHINPNSIVVLDEIEKAHPVIMYLLLQLLGSGQLLGQDFSKTTIIFTSNVGKELYNDPAININAVPDKMIINSIANTERESANGPVKVFPPEITSRLATGNLIVFQHLAPISLREMADTQFEVLTQSMSQKNNWQITYPSSMSTMFFFSYGVDLDARVVTEQSNKFLLHEVYEIANLMNAGALENGASTKIKMSISLDGASDQIKNLFHNPKKTKVLFFADPALKDALPLDTDRYEIFWTDDINQALEFLKQDLDALFIDVLCRPTGDNSEILSVNDYKTQGIELFYKLAAKIMDCNIYVLNRDEQIPEVDCDTLITDGAAKIVPIYTEEIDGNIRQMEAIIDSEYMEKQSKSFSQQGLVVTYKTRQTLADDKTIQVEFYDLQKKMAIDPASRGIMVTEEGVPDLTFDDVIGAKAAKDALQSYIDYLQNPIAYLEHHPTPAKGILFYGPPGTGKTMLAKAMANEAKVHFFPTNAAAFKSKWVGETEGNIRELFAKARQFAPSIIFIDEVDGIAKPRNGEAHDHSGEALTELLVQMDGFSLNPKRPVFVIAATNVLGRGDNAGLDEAFLSRFSQKIEVKLPEKDERLEYIRRALAKRKITSISEEEMDALATRTARMGIRVLQNIIDNAVTAAEREGHEVTIHDLMEAREVEQFGEKSRQQHAPEYYDRVAHHEAGHAVINYLHGRIPALSVLLAEGTSADMRNTSMTAAIRTTTARITWISLRELWADVLQRKSSSAKQLPPTTEPPPICVRPQTAHWKCSAHLVWKTVLSSLCQEKKSWQAQWLQNIPRKPTRFSSTSIRPLSRPLLITRIR